MRSTFWQSAAAAAIAAIISNFSIIYLFYLNVHSSIVQAKHHKDWSQIDILKT